MMEQIYPIKGNLHSPNQLSLEFEHMFFIIKIQNETKNKVSLLLVRALFRP